MIHKKQAPKPLSGFGAFLSKNKNGGPKAAQHKYHTIIECHLSIRNLLEIFTIFL